MKIQVTPWLAVSMLLPLLLVISSSYDVYAQSSVNPPWWNTNWGYKQKIVITNPSARTDMPPFIDFVALVVLDPTRFDYSRAKPDLSDLRFVWNDDTTLLASEIEYVSTTAKSYIWVKLPSLQPYNSATTSATHTHFWLYFNNTDATMPTFTDLWSNYTAVYHGLGYATSSKIMIDSSPNGINLTCSSASKSSYSIDFLGPARQLSGDHYFTASTAAAGSIRSVSLWFYDTYCNQNLLVNSNMGLAGADVIDLAIASYCGASNPYTILHGGSTYGYGSGVPQNEWIYVVGLLNASGSSFVGHLIINGSVYGPTEAKNLSSASRIKIGVNPGTSTGQSPYKGKIDEVRFSSIARTAEWYKYEYNVQRDTVILWSQKYIVNRTSTTGTVVPPATAPLQAGIPFSFLVKDIEEGSVLNPFQVTLVRSEGGNFSTSDIARNTTDLSKYNISATLTMWGTYTVNVMLTGAHLGGSPFTVTVVAHPTSVAGSTAFGDGLANTVVDSWANFTVETRDSYGNLRTAYNDNVTVVIQRPDNQQLTANETIITYQGSSRYLVKWRAVQDGTFSIFVSVNGVNINPTGGWKAVAACHPTSAPLSRMVLNETTLKAGIEYAHTVEAYTIYNTPQTCSIAPKFICNKYSGASAVTSSYIDCIVTGYQVKIVPKKVGNYWIELLLDETTGGSPLPVAITPAANITVVPGAPNKDKCYVTGVSPTGINEKGSFLVNLLDAYSNPVNASGQVLTFTVIPSGYSFTTSVTPVGNALNFTYMTSYQGNFLFTLSINNEVMTNPVFVTIGQACNETAYYMSEYIAGPHVFVAGGVVTVNITARDSNGNQQPCPDPQQFTVSLQHQVTLETTAVPIVYSYQSESMASQVVTKSGYYNVIVKLGNNIITPIQSVLVRAAATDPTSCYAYGPGLNNGTADEEANFTVQCRDKYNNLAETGGNQISMRAFGRQELSVIVTDITDNLDGTYSVHFIPPLDGTIGIKVYVDGQQLPTSFLASFDCNPTVASYSFVYSLINASTVAGLKKQFMIYTRNSNNHRQSCTVPDQFLVHAVGALGNEIKINSTTDKALFEHNNDPSMADEYWFFMDLVKADVFTISVSLVHSDGTLEHIGNSPFEIAVTPGETSAKQSEVTGLPNVLTVNEVATAYVTVNDEYGNRRYIGGDIITIETNPPAEFYGLTYNCTDLGNGEYVLQFSCNSTGQFELSTLVNGEPVPLRQTISILSQPQDCNSVSPTHSEVYFNSLQIVAGSTFNITIFAVDRAGNYILCKNWAKFEVVITLDVDWESNSTLQETVSYTLQAVQTPSRRYEYTVLTQLKIAGNYTVDIFESGQIVTVEELVVIPAATSPSACVVYGEGALEGTADEESMVLVQARDLYSNNRTVGGDSLSLKLIAVRPILTVTEFAYLDNGLYAIRYTAPLDGSLGLRVYINDQQIGNGYLVTFECNPTSYLFSRIDNDTSIVASERHVMNIWTMNSRNRNQTCSVRESFIITVDNPSLPLDLDNDNANAEVKIESESGSNHYTFSGRPTKAGSYVITVELKERHSTSNSSYAAPGGVIGSFVLTVLPGPFDIGNLQLSGPGVQPNSISVGEPTWFIINLLDAYGNQVLKGGDNVTVKAVLAPAASQNPSKKTMAAVDGGLDSVEASDLDFGFQVQDFNNGTYMVFYTPTKAAANKEVVLNIYVNGQYASSKSPTVDVYMYVKPPPSAGLVAGVVIGVLGVVAAVIIAVAVTCFVGIRAYLSKLRAIEEAKPPNFVPLAYTLEYQLPKDNPPKAEKLAALERLLLADERCEFIGALMKSLDKKEVDEVCKALVAIFECHNFAMELIESMVAIEINAQLSSGTLFRANSPATKLMSWYTMMVGLPYLYETLGHLVKEAMSSSASTFEVDRNKLKDGDDANLNKYVLMATTQKMIVAITKSAERMPRQMRELACFLRERCTAKFRDTKYTSVGGYIMLRFITPAITAPDQYGLSKRPLESSHQRLFILICKTLQNLANGVEFSGQKESYMIQLNELITENKQKLNDFFDEVVQIPEDSQPAPIVPMPKDYKQRCLAQLLQFIVDNVEDLEAALQDKPTTLQRLKRFLADEGEDQEMIEYLNQVVFVNNESGSNNSGGALSARSHKSNNKSTAISIESSRLIS